MSHGHLQGNHNRYRNVVPLPTPMFTQLHNQNVAVNHGSMMYPCAPIYCPPLNLLVQNVQHQELEQIAVIKYLCAKCGVTPQCTMTATNGQYYCSSCWNGLSQIDFPQGSDHGGDEK